MTDQPKSSDSCGCDHAQSQAPATAEAPAAPPPALDQSTLDELTALSSPELIARYRWGVENFDRRVFELADEQLDQAFLPDVGVGRWPVRMVLGHLADAELAMVQRIRRTVAEDNPVLGNWDEDAFNDSGLYDAGSPPIGGFVAVVYTLRVWTGEMLGALTPEQWQRRCLHSVRGELTLHELVAFAAWHLERHAWFINRKVERFLGPMPTGCCGGSGKAAGGGCCKEQPGQADEGGSAHSCGCQ